MRAFVPLAAAATLAGCHDAPTETASPADQPNETEVIDQLENEQDAVESAISADAPVANDANAAAASTGAAAKHYTCSDGMVVEATYPSGSGNAVLTIDGKPVTLATVGAASGGKYRLDKGLTPDRSLTWWNKGDSAVLIQTPVGAGEGSPRETRATCLEATPARD